jgi:hypothetical protein
MPTMFTYSEHRPALRTLLAYSVVEYEEDEFGRGDIAVVCRLVDDKLEEYPAPAKIIVYSSRLSPPRRIKAIWVPVVEIRALEGGEPIRGYGEISKEG